MRTQNAEEKYKITLRVNRDLLEELRQAANRGSWTINSYLIHLLTQDLQRQERKSRTKNHE